MKKLATFILIVLGLFSCRDEEDDKIEISESEAVDIVSATLSDDSDAIEENPISATPILTASDPSAEVNCGQPVDYNRDFSRTRGSRTFTYKAEGTRDNICIKDSLIAFEYNSTFTTTYSGPRYSSTGNGTRTGRLDELRSDSLFYLWTGSSSKSSNGTFSARRERQITTSLKLSSNIKLDKLSRMITDGETEFNLSGSGDDTEPFSYSGIIEYLGNRQAILTVNGNTYNITY